MRAFLLVLHGIGVGAQADASDYGDAGACTLLHVAEAAGCLRLPQLERLGLARVREWPGARAGVVVTGAYGRLATRSPGRDSLVSHRELAGLVTARALPVYVDALPAPALDRIAERIGRGWLGNPGPSLVESILRHDAEHRRSGRIIVHAPGASALYFAAHCDVVGPADLLEMCREARTGLKGADAVGRVISVSYDGGTRHDLRFADRHQLALEPEAPTLLDRIAERGRPVLTVGYVDELFAGRGVTDALRTRTTDDALEALADVVRVVREGLIFAGLAVGEQEDESVADAAGLAHALERVDARLGPILDRLRSDDLLLITADHGQDPGVGPGSPTRELVPLLATGPRVRANVDLGIRASLADAGATLAEYFGAARLEAGKSFLREIRA